MEKDLVKFYDNISKINKDLAEYEDEKGNSYIIPMGQLFCSCSYNEFDKNDFTIAAFNKIVDTNIEYQEEKIKKAVSKQEVTKDVKDKYTLTEKEVIVKKVWVVQNGLKISKSFNNKEDALDLVHKINNELLKQAEQI